MRVVVRSEEYLPASRREMPPAPLGFHGPYWRTYEDLTGAESAVAVAIAAVLYAAAWLTQWRLGIGGDGHRESLAFLPVPLTGIYTLWWAPRRQPWYGPRRLRRRPRPPRPPGRLRRAFASFGSWWCPPGRPALAGGLIAALFGAMFLSNAADDDALVHDLESRGVRVDAHVSRVHYIPRGRDDVKVSFPVGSTQRAESLRIIDTIPRHLHVGDPVEVVFDPRDPSRVLLSGQLNESDARTWRTMAVIAFVLAGAGGLWWFAATPRRWAQRRVRSGRAA